MVEGSAVAELKFAAVAVAVAAAVAGEDATEHASSAERQALARPALPGSQEVTRSHPGASSGVGSAAPCERG